MTSNTLGLLVGLCTAGLYGYSMYYLHTPQVLSGFDRSLPKYKAYGHFKYLTVQCLLIQLISSALHVLAHFVRPLRGVRDFVFTTLAFPIGSVVVYTFWLVWFGMGREFLFPQKLDSFYPNWLNQTNHTVFVPVNIILAALVQHKYLKNAVLVTFGYMACYMIFLHVFRAQVGLFIYPYLDKLDDLQRMLYFAGASLLTYLMYKFGQLITSLAHKSGPTPTPTKRPASKGSKQR